MINYQFGILIAVVSVVYSYILTQPDMLLNSIYNKLYRFFKTDQRAENGRSIHPLFMVLMYCEKCFAGQAALWLYFPYMVKYDFLQHLFFVSFTILMASTIKHLYTKHIE